MRSRLSAPVALLYLLFTLLLLTVSARAADDDTHDTDEYEEHARVLRVSLLKGEVSLKRAGDDEWTSARLNTPLVEGDLLATGRDSRLEIQSDSRNFIRVGPESVLKVVTLRDEGIALSLNEGTATFRLARFDRDKEYFELDAPGTTIAAEKTGQYRVDVDHNGGVNVTVREDGRARIYSQTSGFILRNNRTARFAREGSDEGDWEVGAAAQFDEWAHWNDERESYLASRLHYEGRDRYYDADIYGAEELDLYGDWVYTRDYGYVWRPHTTVVNNYYDWAPYRYGHWEWCAPYGWTWIADESWGWAPYHYGRWVYINNNWCWAPRGYGYPYHRAWWRPALVAFVTIDFGRDRHVCWYPLTYGQRDPRGRWWSHRYNTLTPLRSGEIGNLRRANPALLRAVTSVPARDFGTDALRARAAGVDLAQRALASDPVRGQLPIARSDASRGVPRVNGGAIGGRATGATGRDVLTINRTAPVMPARSLPERATGAAVRTPGVPLDEELRRARIFNNREPRVPLNAVEGGNSQGGLQGRDSGTGAVERPGITGGRMPSNPGDDSSGNRAAPARVSPSRSAPPDRTSPVYPSGGDEPTVRGRNPDAGDDPRARRTSPTRPPVEQTPIERGGEATRDSGSKPSPVYRPEPRVRPRDEGEHTSPPTTRREEPPARREEPPAYRPEPRAPRESQPTRSDPPSQRQEPRHEQSRPEPRQEAPRQEAPKQEAPRHERPAASDSEPPAKRNRR
ncbi:MAG: hypothetical protein QOE46_1382 [Acidobacteriota bacterium]|jgi:hypothetical protein|nr:hypothetical protein [Acidobacteriota bacterium]